MQTAPATPTSRPEVTTPRPEMAAVTVLPPHPTMSVARDGKIPRLSACQPVRPYNFPLGDGGPGRSAALFQVTQLEVTDLVG